MAEKSGYPKDMLDLDLDLEADLGIDTVKQAEMFAAVRAAYNIPRDENLKLRDFPTLAHVIKFARDRQPGRPKRPLQALRRECETRTGAEETASACIFGFEADYDSASGPRQFRRRQSYSTPRTCSQLAPAACHLQANRRDARDPAVAWSLCPTNLA